MTIVRVRRKRNDFRDRGGWEAVLEIDREPSDVIASMRMRNIKGARLVGGEIVIEVAA